jgi:tRNA pseudouridine55 synthase
MSTAGILLVDKPAGITSHDVVSRVRRFAGTRKIGHAGTLDPMATGLLLLGIDSSTRLLTYLVGLDKTYLATIRLGLATTTDDAEGEPIGTPADTGAVTAEAIVAAIEPLTGEISQVPSAVSAIKVDGKRSYNRVRDGEQVVLAARTVTVSTFEVLDLRRGFDGIDLDIRVDCSSGTYIRALARDLGIALGVGGHLTALRRTRIGPFSIEHAAALPDRDQSGAPLMAALLDPASVARRLFPEVALTASERLELQQGKRPRLSKLPAALADDEGPIAAIGENGELTGLISTSAGVGRVLVNFPTAPGQTADRLTDAHPTTSEGSTA